MSAEQEGFRDWHRLFGLLLTDYFTDSPFAVDVERDLSVQQQLIDVVIVRRGRGRFAGHLPRRNWSSSAAATTCGARSRPAGCWGSFSRRFEGRALTCRSRWRTSIASTSKNTSGS